MKWDAKDRTPAQERDVQIHCAKVYLREARARRVLHPRFAGTLLQWAANCRRRASEIDTRPAQGSLFGSPA